MISPEAEAFRESLESGIRADIRAILKAGFEDWEGTRSSGVPTVDYRIAGQWRVRFLPDSDRVVLVTPAGIESGRRPLSSDPEGLFAFTDESAKDIAVSILKWLTEAIHVVLSFKVPGDVLLADIRRVADAVTAEDVHNS